MCIYCMQSHPCLSLEERSRLCRCLNYNKLSLEACKELAKNPRIPPRVAVEALAAQSRSSSYSITNSPALDPSHLDHDHAHAQSSYYIQTMINVPIKRHSQMVLCGGGGGGGRSMIKDKNIDKIYKEVDQDQKIISIEEENDMMRSNLQRMQWKVMELEKVCKGMKGQMSRMGKNGRSPSISQAQTKAAVPRFC